MAPGGIDRKGASERTAAKRVAYQGVSFSFSRNAPPMRVIAARPLMLPELDVRRSVGCDRATGSGDARLSTLTRREREVHRGIDAGLSVREIASLLSRSPKTVERHRRNAKVKLATTSTESADEFAWNGSAS